MIVFHPAHQIEFKSLVHGLLAAKSQGFVREQVHPHHHNLSIFCYTKQCVFEKAWNLSTRIARGLVIDRHAGKIVATPFPKFFNYGERIDDHLPNLPFDVFDKMDGSLGVAFHYAGEWHVATKGSFMSEQAKRATEWLRARPPSDPTITYLFEIIYAENRIVIQYPLAMTGLHLLGAYGQNGEDFGNTRTLRTISAEIGWPMAETFHGVSFRDLLNQLPTLPKHREGFVLRYDNGQRFKLKGEAYMRIHRAISGLTPLHVWRLMQANADLGAFKRDLPEEFHGDFHTILALLTNKRDDILRLVEALVWDLRGCSAKEAAQALQYEATIDFNTRKLFFPVRNKQLYHGSRSWMTLHEMFRPTGNVLPGYVPGSHLLEAQDALETE